MSVLSERTLLVRMGLILLEMLEVEVFGVYEAILISSAVSAMATIFHSLPKEN